MAEGRVIPGIIKQLSLPVNLLRLLCMFDSSDNVVTRDCFKHRQKVGMT